MLLILSISIPIIFVIIIFVSSYVYRFFKIRDNVYVKGILLGKIDINNRKILAYNNRANQVMPRQFYLTRSLGKWASLDNLLDHYKGQRAEKIIRSMLVDIQSEKTLIKSDLFLSTNARKTRIYDSTLTMFKIEGSSDIGMSLVWKLKSEEKKVKKPKIEPSTKPEIAELNFLYKGFLSFKLKSGINDMTSEFIEQLSRFFNLNKHHYFLTNGMFIIVIGDKKASRLKVKILKLISSIENNGAKIGLNRMYNGTSYTIGKNVQTPKRINSVLELLNFNINLSLRTDKQFVNRETLEFNLNEYKVVAEGIKVFRNAIKTKEISSKIINIKNEESKRKIMISIFPVIDGITKEIQSIILRDQDHKDLLTNAYAEMVAIEGFINEPALIDINNSWFVKNYQNMNYKRAIYVLNFNPFNDVNTEKEIKELTNSGFTFAIRLKVFNKNITTIIKKSKPKFIVVDQALSEVKEPENYIQLLSIKKLADQENIRIIYENPSSNVDSSMAKTLGIKYVYRF